MSWLPAALAYGLIHRGCSPAELAAHAMLWPRGGRVPQQTKAGRAIKPGQGASNLAPRCNRCPVRPLPRADHGTGISRSVWAAQRSSRAAGDRSLSVYVLYVLRSESSYVDLSRLVRGNSKMSQYEISASSRESLINEAVVYTFVVHYTRARRPKPRAHSPLVGERRRGINLEL